ncbi:peptidoglycan editing factor PgeF [Magnetospirillum moscoviense]|uniref:Purine nucleoside phosphorylase n=1 Tax=Magnetospirillum moscoviense TaxID=1437059 RepID=A0A178MXD6_9PROT|nr:peptidoglycan editing factor PgeF [Magnetospirillum moscoviense]OAN53985.1 polyphenol oxidase [Magnetospirillum moscoviense]
MITLSALNEIMRIRHAFFTREGGVSTGIYASLNCGPGSNDEPSAVAENRSRAMAMLNLPDKALVTVHQAHTAESILVDAPFASDSRPVADGMVTTRPGLALGILTADCAPVLFADRKGGVIGAAHAGWKGALAGILDNTLARMAEQGAKAKNVVAAIGPCIGQRSYEVGPDFPAAFLAESADNADFFAPSPKAGHFLFDLPGYVSRKLARLGVQDVTRLPADTLRDKARFFSYRRTTLAGEPDYGRQLSVIVLER